jgi:hypothetical protein
MANPIEMIDARHTASTCPASDCRITVYLCCGSECVAGHWHHIDRDVCGKGVSPKANAPRAYGSKEPDGGWNGDVDSGRGQQFIEAGNLPSKKMIT